MAGSLIAGGLGLVGSLVGSKSAGKAADASAAAAAEAAQVQREAIGQSRIDLFPQQAAAFGALTALTREMGLGVDLSSVAPRLDFGPLGIDTRTGQLRGSQAAAPPAPSLPSQALGGGQASDPAIAAQIARLEAESSGAPAWEQREAQRQIAALRQQDAQAFRNSVQTDVSNRLGLTPQGQAQAPANALYGPQTGFQQTPGYEFAFQQGTQAVDRSAAARGGLNSGATIKAQTAFGQGLANQEYGNYINRLMNIAGLSSAGQQANNALVAGQGMAQTATAGGNARAAGYLGQGNALIGGLNAIGAAAGDYFGRQSQPPFIYSPAQSGNALNTISMSPLGGGFIFNGG